MPPTFLQINRSASVNTVTLPSLSAGTVVMLGVYSGGAGITISSDTQGLSWTKQTSDNNNYSVQFWSATNASALASTFTVTIAGASGFRELALAEYNGLTGAVRNTNKNHGVGTAITGGAVTTVVGDLVVGWLTADGVTVTADAGWNQRTTGEICFQDAIASGTSTNPSATSSSIDWEALSVAFVPSPGQGALLSDKRFMAVVS